MFILAAESPLFALFENNLINWVVLLIFVGWLMAKFMPGLLAGRKNKIETMLDEAVKARKEGQAFLEEQKVKVANAEAEAENILVEAKKVAEQMKVQITEQTKSDIADLARKMENQIHNERNMAVAELRAQAATAAVRLAEASLPGAVTDSARSRLLSQFVEQLDTVGSNK